MDFQMITFSPIAAATAAGLSAGQLANWQDRYDAIPHRRAGRGVPAFYLFNDILQIAAIAALVDHGLTPKAAIDALRPYTVTAALMGSGVFRLVRNKEGRWYGGDNPEAEVSIDIRMWPIFDRVFPAVVNSLRAQPGKMSAAEVEASIAEFTAFMNERRQAQKQA